VPLVSAAVAEDVSATLNKATRATAKMRKLFFEFFMI
jgi:hypothetical protein